MALLTTDLVRGAAPRDALSAPLRAYIAVAFAGFAGLAAVHGLAFAAMEPVRWLPAFALYACASTVTGLLLARHFPHGRLGWCNGVTQARLALGAVLLTPLAAGAPGGWAIVLVPYDPKTPVSPEDPAADTPAKRMAAYGHPFHYRYYGADLPDRLAEAGFAAHAVDSRRLLTPHQRRRFRINRNHLFACRRLAIPGR
jgi:hypothetical protein